MKNKTLISLIIISVFLGIFGLAKAVYSQQKKIQWNFQANIGEVIRLLMNEEVKIKLNAERWADVKLIGYEESTNRNIFHYRLLDNSGNIIEERDLYYGPNDSAGEIEVLKSSIGNSLIVVPVSSLWRQEKGGTTVKLPSTTTPSTSITGDPWKLIYRATKPWTMVGLAYAEYQGKLYTNNDRNVIMSFDGKSWRDEFALTNKYFPAITVFNNKLYAIAGGGGVSDIYVYDGNNWQKEYTVDAELLHFVIYQNELYAYGNRINTFLVRKGPGDWQVLKFEGQNNIELQASAAISFANKLFFSSGTDGHFYAYDGENLEIAAYNNVGDGCQPNPNDSYAVHQNHLYCLKESGRVCIYNSEIKKFTFVFSLPLKRGEIAVNFISYQNKIYFGINTQEGSGRILVYENGQIKTSLATNKHRGFGQGFGIYNNDLYVSALGQIGTGLDGIYVLDLSNHYPQLEREVSEAEVLTQKPSTAKLIRLKNEAGIYLIDELTGLKKPIVDSSLLKNYGYSFKDVKIVDKKEFDRYQTGEALKLQEGSLVKEAGKPTVYVVENGELRPIASPSTMKKYGYDWKNIQIVPKKVIDLHEIGAIKK